MENIDLSILPNDDDMIYQYSINTIGYSMTRPDIDILKENGIYTNENLYKAYLKIQNKEGNFSKSVRDIITANFLYFYHNYIEKIYKTRQVSILAIREKIDEYVKDFVDYFDNNPDCKIRIIGLNKSVILKITNIDNWMKLSIKEKENFILDKINKFLNIDAIHIYGNSINKDLFDNRELYFLKDRK